MVNIFGVSEHGSAGPPGPQGPAGETSFDVITWFPNFNTYTQPFYSLGKMTDPYLKVFRGLIPAIFGIDLSPILGFLLLNFFIDFFSSASNIV